MRFCEECGAQLEDDAKFCDECGTPVADLEEEQVTEKVETQEETKAEVESVGQNDEEEENNFGEQQENVPESLREKQPKPVKTSGEKMNGGSKKKDILIATILGALLVVGIIIGIVLLGKGREDKDDKKDPVKQEEVDGGDSAAENERQDGEITKAVTDEKTEEETYPLLEEFIDVVCSYSDPPLLEGDAWDEYFKGLYDSWVSGHDFTNIVVGEDGHLKIQKEYLFGDAPYGVYMVTTQNNNKEYIFLVLKESKDYFAEFMCSEGFLETYAVLNIVQDGIPLDETTVAGKTENTGEWIEVMFSPCQDGENWFYVDGNHGGISDLFVNAYISMENVTLMTFDNYQDYYAFVYE